MPEMEISEDQREYIESLRAELAAEHVDGYGVVRPRDALQFLIDQYEDGDAAGDAGEPATDADATVDTDTAGDTDTENGADTGDADEGAASAESRLDSMMSLLDEHDDKWEEVDAEDGKYAVTLPDGETEHVRTKDDVRATLFKNY
ncbi:hypothetical protein BRC83_09435 [Halobacteriales archaeon QS_1_68_17]|nr:MAG: hypothetical protein BRC83_09435 [Halobacteriales archaeon QS_1_68_17]